MYIQFFSFLFSAWHEWPNQLLVLRMLLLQSVGRRGGLPCVTGISQHLVMCRASCQAVQTIKNTSACCAHQYTRDPQSYRTKSVDRNRCLNYLSRKNPCVDSEFSSTLISRSFHSGHHIWDLTHQRQKCNDTSISHRTSIFKTHIRHLFYERDAKSGYGGKVWHMINCMYYCILYVYTGTDTDSTVLH